MPAAVPATDTPPVTFGQLALQDARLEGVRHAGSTSLSDTSEAGLLEPMIGKAEVCYRNARVFCAAGGAEALAALARLL